MICSANPPAVRFFDGPLNKRSLWAILEVDVSGIDAFLESYPAENVHEIPYGEKAAAILCG